MLMMNPRTRQSIASPRVSGFTLIELLVVISIIALLIAILLRVLFWFFFECPAIGLVLLTRAGGRPRRRPEVASPEVPAAPTPPVPAVPSQAPGTSGP